MSLYYIGLVCNRGWCGLVAIKHSFCGYPYIVHSKKKLRLGDLCIRYVVKFSKKIKQFVVDLFI